MLDPSEVLFIGGRSGVGKSSVAFEMSTQLAAVHASHAVIEGDNLDMAYPPPWEHGLAERNLASVWRNYLDLGYRRLIYTNTNSVCSVDELVAAIGGRPRVVAVLLTATDGDDSGETGPATGCCPRAVIVVDQCICRTGQAGWTV